ncbi:unnamed protein product [Jaminaea pallidilutea]
MPPQQLNPLPFSWYLFFGILEPLSTIGGAAMALFQSDNFYHDLVPLDFKSSSGVVKSFVGEATGGVLGAGPLPDEARMAVAQLGSCYFLLCLVSLFLFASIRRNLVLSPQHSHLATPILSSLLMALAIADWSHILLTIYYLPPAGVTSKHVAFWMKFFTQPASWNGLLAGNILATLALFTARMAWFAGVGRASGDTGAGAKKSQ